MGLCNKCGTCVVFEKEDFVKLQFQNGKKIFYHMECFSLDFVRVSQLKGVSHENTNKVEGTRVGVLDSQGNLFP
jgi:hypothetical protein